MPSRAGITPPRPQQHDSLARPLTRSTSSAYSSSAATTAPMDSSFSWSPASSASSVFAPPHQQQQLRGAPPYPFDANMLAGGAAAAAAAAGGGFNVKEDPDGLAAFPALRLASASEAESSTADTGDESRRSLRGRGAGGGSAAAGGGAGASGSKARAAAAGAKGSSKRAKVSEEDDDDGDGEADGADSADGAPDLTRKLSLKTRNRLKQRAHRERRALHLSTLESQVAEMSTLRADLAAAQAALAHTDAVAQGQRMTYEAVIRDLSLRDREREGLLLAFQSEIFRLRAILGQGAVPAAGGGGGAANASQPAAEQQNAEAGAGTSATKGVASAPTADNGVPAQVTLDAPPPANFMPPPPPQPFPFTVGQPGVQQPFYFFAPPPHHAHGSSHPPAQFAGPVWQGPPPVFGPPPQQADGKNGSRNGSAAFQVGPPPPLLHQPGHAPPPSSQESIPYNLFPPHLRPQATGLSPTAPSPENLMLSGATAEPASGGAAGGKTSPALSQTGFPAKEKALRSASPSGAAGSSGAVSSPPVPSSSKLLSTLPQLQTQFQPPPPVSTVVANAGARGSSNGAAGDKEALDGLAPIVTSPSILTPTAAAPHPGGLPPFDSNGPGPSPLSAFQYGTGGGSYSSGLPHSGSWDRFMATTPTNGMGSALWGGLGVPGQSWPWMGGGVSPVATSPAWAAWGSNPLTARPSSSGEGDAK